MKNDLFYSTLQYRYSFLSDKNMTIGVLFYDKKKGEITFLEGRKELNNLTFHYPTLKPQILEAYFTLIQNKIIQTPPQKELEKIDFQAYIYHSILRLDDSALQFSPVSGIKNEEKIKEKYLQVFLPLTYTKQQPSSQNRQLLEKFDVLTSHYLTPNKQKEIYTLSKSSVFSFDRVWKKQDSCHLVKIIDSQKNKASQFIKQLLVGLSSLPLPPHYQIDIWLNTYHSNEDTFEIDLQNLNSQLKEAGINIFLPEQWTEYVKSIESQTYMYEYNA